jgi:hypothetical protein
VSSVRTQPLPRLAYLFWLLPIYHFNTHCSFSLFYAGKGSDEALPRPNCGNGGNDYSPKLQINKQFY